MIWVYQNLVGMPRVAAIEHPFGRPYGECGDAETQRAVLEEALAVFDKAKEPGHVEHLPFVWHEDPQDTKWHPAEPSPIIALMAGRPGASGWGIPMATDIAFVVGCMAVLGPRIPHGLRVLLLSLAIADDIGAILVIAVGYTETIHLAALAWGGVGIACVAGAARLGVRSFGVYVALGVGVWPPTVALG